jgi:predicted ABC-type ATPase
VPLLTIIAGPNGSGKTSVMRSGDFEGKQRLIDADQIAREMSLADPSLAAIAAGREALRRIEEYLTRGESFAFETTLSSRHTIQMMKRAKETGFAVSLLYVCLEKPDFCIGRIEDRVAKGGHFIPDDDVRRRYQRSLANLPEALRSADTATAYDNTAGGARRVIEACNGRIVWRSEKLPPWAESVLAEML